MLQLLNISIREVLYASQNCNSFISFCLCLFVCLFFFWGGRTLLYYHASLVNNTFLICFVPMQLLILSFFSLGGGWGGGKGGVSPEKNDLKLCYTKRILNGKFSPICKIYL